MRFVVRARFRACAPSVLVLLGLAVLGCKVWGNDVVNIRVIVPASAQNHQITDLSLIVGSDKYSWPDLSPGADRNVNLAPGPEDDRQLFFLYTFDGEKRSWEGPKFDVGTGYRMEITIDANGHVASRHCILPCSLS